MFERITFDQKIMGGGPAFEVCAYLFLSLLDRSRTVPALKKS